jgi:tetratricopeptide (TPR) repeat protein
MARLTLCLIARDEERMLPGCLDSVRGAVDEIVVVDTGSRDRTPEIARAAGAKVVPFAWCDDFAAARNAALPHATGEWILVLDADERLAPRAGRALREEIERPGPWAGVLPLHEASSADADLAAVVAGTARRGEPTWLLRLVRRAPDLRWDGVVHEHVADFLRRHGRTARRVRADVVHLGGDPALRRARGKSDRNVALLERRCRLDPDDAIAWGYLAMELYERGRSAEASAAAERGWEATRRSSRVSLRGLVVRGLCAVAAGDGERAVESAELGRRRLGECDALAYVAGLGAELLALRAGSEGERARRAAEAEAAYRAALSRADAVELDRCVVGASGWLSSSRLGEVLLLAGRPAEALGAFDAALAARPGLLEAALGRAEALLDLGAPADALAAIEPLVERGADAWLLAAGAAQALGATADARTLLHRVLDGSAGKVQLRRGERLRALRTALAEAR